MHKPLTKLKRAYLAIFLSVCITGGLFVSCKKGTPSWDTNILAPIIYTSLSMNNLVADSLVKANPADSSLSLVYNGTIYDLNTDTLIKIPDTTLVYDYISYFNTTVAAGNAIVPTNISSTTYGVGGVDLKKASIKVGEADVFVTSTINQPTDLKYIIPSATLGGNPLTIYIKVGAGSQSSPAHAQKSYSLAGYNIDFSGPSHNNYNTITTNVNVIVDSAAGTATIIPYDSVDIKVIFHNISPSYARGYFGTQTKSYNSQANFPLFSRVVAGKLTLNSISASMSLANYFGVDAQVNLSQLASYNSPTNTTVNLNAPSIINNVININRATETGNPNNPVIPSVQTFTISPAAALLWVDNLPNIVKYSITATTDPLGNVSGYNDFAYAGPGIESNLNISIPLNLIATNLTLEDTLNVNFATGGNQAKNVKSGTFTLYADNGFPFSAGMQVYLLDSLYHITDSLMAGPQTIAAGNLNANGIVTSPQTSVLNIVVGTSKMQTLLKTKHLIMYSRFNMGCLSCLPPQYRKIYSYNLLNIKLVGNFDYLING